MCEALQQRIADIEELIGINNLSTSEPLDFDLASLKKRLQNVDAGFVMQIPIDKLHRLKQFYINVIFLTYKKRIFFIECY